MSPKEIQKARDEAKSIARAASALADSVNELAEALEDTRGELKSALETIKDLESQIEALEAANDGGDS